ncbi:MAG: hypothetical protein WC683_06850 [bacterium]
MGSARHGNRGCVTSLIARGKLVPATAAHYNVAVGFASVCGGKAHRRGLAIEITGTDPGTNKVEYKAQLREAFRNSGYAACQVKILS